MDRNAFAKNVDQYRTAQSEQADMGRNFSLIWNFLHTYLNSLPSEKILDWSKLKSFADDKRKLA